MKKLKQFGQHFLNNIPLAKQMVERIVSQSGCKNIVEVGPGEGVLTQFFLQQPSINFKVVEIDNRLIELLPIKFPALAGKIIHADFLTVDLNEIFNGESFALVGNFPYNISSQIVFKALDNQGLVPFLAGMFQKEFADRVVSIPKKKAYGIPSVLVQLDYATEQWFDVPPEAFTPPPKVWSSVISIIKKNETQLEFDKKLFKNIVKTAFNNRRKMLRNTLSGFAITDCEAWEKMKTQRPEELHFTEFITLTNLIQL